MSFRTNPQASASPSPAAKNNARSLEEIETAVRKAEVADTANIFVKGDLWNEARAQLREKGQWVRWFKEREFEDSLDTAYVYMKIAAVPFRKFRKLQIGRTTQDEIANHKPEEQQEAMINELAKYATDAYLKHNKAVPVMQTGIGKHRYRKEHPGCPDVTYWALVEWSHNPEKFAALLERRPTTYDDVDEIVDEVDAAERERREQSERAFESERAPKSESVAGQSASAPESESAAERPVTFRNYRTGKEGDESVMDADDEDVPSADDEHGHSAEPSAAAITDAPTEQGPPTIAPEAKISLLTAWGVATPSERETICSMVLNEFFAQATGTDVLNLIPVARRPEVHAEILDWLAPKVKFRKSDKQDQAETSR